MGELNYQRGTLYINGEEFCVTNNIEFNGCVDNIAELNYKAEFTSLNTLSMSVKVKIYPETILLFDENLKDDSRFIKLKNQFYKTKREEYKRKL